MKKTHSLVKRITSLFLSLVFVLTSFAAVNVSTITALADENEYFLMAYFTGNLQTEQQIKFAVSDDGSNFKPLYGGNAVLQEKSTDTNNYDGYTYTDGVRDPYIFDGHDGYYYCIATDLEATAYSFWGTQSQMVLWRSKDLINWSDAYYINVAQICNAKRGTSFTNSDFQRTWAPEVFYEDGQYMIYFAFAGGDYQATRMHYMITDDLMDWTHYSAPQVLYDPGYDDIDADIVKEGNTYYMFYKDETPGRSTVCLATASALTGPYTFIGQFDTTSATGGIEGCEVYTVGDNYYLVADRFGAAGNFAIYNLGSSLSAVAAASSEDHISVTSAPISTVQELYGFTNLTPRHGSIMHISQSQYNALVAASGGVTNDDIMYNFTKTYSRTTDGWAYEGNYADSSLHNCDFMFKESGSSVKVAHDGGYVTLKNATIFVNDETVRGMLPDDVYTVSFDYALESNTNLSAPIFALGTGSGAPSENTDYVMIFGNGDMWVRKSGESSDTFVAGKALKLGVTYHYDVVSDGTNIKFFRDGELIGSIAATVDFPDSGTRFAAFGYTDGHSSAGYGYGSYSHIRFRDRAVSASQIKAEADKTLVYQKNDGTATVDGKSGVINVSKSENKNVVEPVISHTAPSYTLSGWVNPGASIDYNSVIMSIGNEKWTPAPYGRYFAVREDGTIAFNYCSGANSGGNWSQHYVDITSAFSLETNTWAYLQINIVPISDNQVKVVVYKNGVQTKSQDITLKTKINDNDSDANDYAYGILGMLQLPTNKISLGHLGAPDWWQNNDGTTYVKDVRFYAQAMDPDELYEKEVAREAVAASISTYDVTSNTFTAKAYHVADEATNGYNNLVYAPSDTTTWNACAYDTSDNKNQTDGDNGRIWNMRYKLPMPLNTVMVYDGVEGHTPATPVVLEMWSAGGWTKIGKIYYDGTDINGTNNDKFILGNSLWYGFTQEDDNTNKGNVWRYWPGTQYDADNIRASGDDWNGTISARSGDYDDTRHDGTKHMFWWNKLAYNGSGDTTNYYEKYNKITYDVYSTNDGNSYGNWTTEHLQNDNATVYVLNYAPVYNALKNTGFTGVPNGENGTKGASIKALAMALSSDAEAEALYTTSSVDNLYYAAYKLMNCNPNSYLSNSTAAGDVESKVQECASDIKEAMDAFNNVNLQLRASFTDVDAAYAQAQDIIANNSDDYTEASINALKAVLSTAVWATNKDEEFRANTAATIDQAAIDAEEDAISDAINALVEKKTVTFVEYSGASTSVKYDPNTSAATVEADAPALPANSYDSENNKHYTYAWDNAFADVTANATYTQVRNEVEHSYASYTHNSGTNTHNATCAVNGQNHTDTFDCEFESTVVPTSGNVNGYTTYTCQYCGYSYTTYEAQNWTAYEQAVEAYDAKAAEEDFEAHYTAASKEAFAAAADAKFEEESQTISQSAINNATTALNNAVSGLAVQNYTISFKKWGSSTKTTVQLPYGTSAEAVATEAPENTATDYNDDRHYTYAWETFTAVSEDKNYIETRTSTVHSYTPVYTPADSTTNGYTTYTCECGRSYVEYDSLETVKTAYTAALDDYNETVADEDFETTYTAASRTACENAFAAITLPTEDQLDSQSTAPSVFTTATAAINAAIALLEVNEPDNSYNLTLTDNIDVNFDLDTEYYEAKDVVKFNVSYIDVTDNKSATRTNFDVELDDLETGAANLTLLAAPAQLAEPYVITPVDGTGAAVGEPIEVSVQDYCKSIINGEYSAEDKAVAQALLNYGALAAEYFDYATTKEDPTYAVQHAGDYKDAVALSDIKTKGAKTPVYSAGVDASGAVINVTGISYVAISEPEFRFYVSQASDVWCSYTDLRIDGDGLSANWIKTEHGNCVSVTGLKASDFAKDFTLHIGGTDLTYNGYTFLYTVLAAETTEENESLQDLAKGIFRYASACQDKFAATV